jgi:hypothetical protein
MDPDYFSDSESNHPNDEEEMASLEQDEQHTQKVNGQIQSLKVKLKELEEELKREKKAHEISKEALNAVLPAGGATASSGSEAPTFSQELILLCRKFSVECPQWLNASLADSDITKIFKSVGKASKLTFDNQSRPVTSHSMQSMKSADEASRPRSQPTSDALLDRIHSLEQELRLALGAAEDIKALKAKLLQMIDRLRSEKEARDKQAFDIKTLRKKLAILTDHIEKLMTHLKHEAAAKIRALETLREQEKTTLIANEKCIKLNQRCIAKDRLIMELREGGKILEDQLRLMDEKYLELRTKLDFARESSEKRIRKAERVAGDLRVKFALLGNTKSLDALPMPTRGYANSIEGGFSMSDTGDGFSASFVSDGASVSKSSKKSHSTKHSKTAIPEKQKTFETDAEKEEEVQRLLEKMRLKRGSSANWNEEKARALVESR